MRIISFAWTTPALVTGHKSVTRRDWDAAYTQRFRKGDLLAAYDRSPRFKGQRVGTIRLIEAPTIHSTADAPLADYHREGFDFLDRLGAKVDGLPPPLIWRAWALEPRLLTVVRFDLVDLTEYGEELRARYEAATSLPPGALLPPPPELVL